MANDFEYFKFAVPNDNEVTVDDILSAQQTISALHEYKGELGEGDILSVLGKHGLHLETFQAYFDVRYRQWKVQQYKE